MDAFAFKWFVAETGHSLSWWVVTHTETDRGKEREKRGFPVVLINNCASDREDCECDHQEKRRVRQREAECVISGSRDGVMDPEWSSEERVSGGLLTAHRQQKWKIVSLVELSGKKRWIHVFTHPCKFKIILSFT